MTLFIRGNTIIDAAGGQSVEAGDFQEGLREEGKDDGDIGEEKRKETILFIYLREK